MRHKLFIVFSLLILFIDTQLSAQWRIIATLPHPTKISFIYFLDKEKTPLVGFAGGTDLWRTSDHGISWTKVMQGKFGTVEDITFKDSLNGWLATGFVDAGPLGNIGKGYIYHTNDGGNSWQKVPTASQGYNTAIYFNHFSNLILVSRWEDSSLLSSDEGLTWKTFGEASDRNGYSFIGDSIGISTTGPDYSQGYIRTTDGGLTWNFINDQNTQVAPKNFLGGWQPVSFYNTNLFLVLSEDWSYNVLSKSTDLGKTWQYIYPLHSFPFMPTGQLANSHTRIYGRVRDGSNPGFYMSEDTGKSWFGICGPPDFDADTRFYEHNDEIFAGANENEIWYTPYAPAGGIWPIIRPSQFNIGSAAVCEPIDSILTITGLCTDFKIISIIPEDTSLLKIEILDSLPKIVSEQPTCKIRIRITPKKVNLGLYYTYLKIRFNLDSIYNEIEFPITSDELYMNPNQFSPLEFKINQLCDFDTLLNIYNKLCDSIIITSISSSDSKKIDFPSSSLPLTIQPGETLPFQMTLIPTIGIYLYNIVITYIFEGVEYSTGIPTTVNVVKNKLELSLSSNKINFDTTYICKPKTKMFMISNTRCHDITISSFAWQPSISYFTFIKSPPTPLLLKPGETDTIIVQYAPSTIGLSNARVYLQLQSDGETIDTTLNFLGFGRSSTVLSLDHPQLNFDTVSTCSSLTKSVTLFNDNCDSILVSLTLSPSQLSFIKTNPPLPIEVQAGDSLHITITYSPKKSGFILDSIQLQGQTKTGNSEIQTLLLSGYGESDGGVLSYSPKQFNFKSLSFCQHDSSSGFLTNIGCDSLLLDPTNIFSDPDFSLTANNSPLKISPGDTMKYQLYLNPGQKGFRQGFLVLTSSDKINTNHDTVRFTVTITEGTVILSSSLSVLDFGAIPVCDAAHDTLVTLQNTGCDTLVISGIGLQGSGFGTNTSFPIIILPGKDTTIDIFTLLDTAGGKLSTTGILTFNSNSDNTLAPIILSRTFIQAAHRDVRLYLDPSAKAGGDLSTVSYDIKESPGKTFTGAGIQNVTFDLNYNTDLLNFTQSKSSNITSSDGRSFTISGNPITANANGVLATIGFTVYLTKDSVTDIIMISRTDTTALPCGLMTLSTGGSASFDYNYLCGERSISGFMNGSMPMRIVSLHPNPSQDETELDLQSEVKQDATIEIFDALGAKVFSEMQGINTGANQIHLDTKGLSSGMYMVRIGSVSGSFLKIK